ncbi:reverse transcriptase domain-containing protein [Tanacetum coccineum]
MDGGMVERNSDGRPLKQRGEDNRHQEVNLPPLLILGLHEEQRISRFVHGLKIRSLMEFLSTDLSTTYKGLMERTYTWIEVREVTTNGTLNDHQESLDKFKKKSSWDNNKGKKNKYQFSLYCGSNHGLLSNLSKSPREILATKKVVKTFEQPPRLIESRRSCDMSKYCHFHEDHGHDTNQCWELKHQIEEAIKSGQLAHLVKGIKEGKAKVSDTQLERRDGVVVIKRRRQDLHRDSVRDLVTMLGSGYQQKDRKPSQNDKTEHGMEKTVQNQGQKAVLQLLSPRTIKEVQSLNGKLASLNRFFSKSTEKSLKLFKTLKNYIKKSDFHWTPEAKHAFKQLKQHLSELPLLVAPKPKEALIVYLSTTHGAISAVLMTERGTVQTTVYFVSRALQGPELNHTPMEKQVLSLVFVAKRLRRYFQAYLIAILADFHEEKPDESPQDTPVVEIPQEPWTLFMDGSSCVDGSGAGLILTSLEGTEFTYALRFQFTASNNEAEYEALIAGLQIAAHMGVRNVHVSVDSKLVANQILGTYFAKEENMAKYLEKAKSLISGFANFSISQVPISKNKKADALSKISSTSFAHLSKQVLVEILKEKSIQEKEVATVVEEEGPTWMTPIIEYLKNGTIPGDRKEASKLRIKARQYELLEGVLYRRSFLKPWLRIAVRGSQGHTIGILLTTMHRDARDMIRTSGPFPEEPGKVKFFIVAMDYFTKWIEAKAVATITGNQVKKFMWDNIVCRFGLPREIVSDNGKQFSDNPFKD